jgi:transcriptional regulator with XRE-family HTH domain
MEGELQMVVGENLRRVRRAMGFSQESFGEHVGWHRTFVGSVERGERNLTLRTVERLAAQLEVDPLDLLLDPEAAAAAPVLVLHAADAAPGGASEVVGDAPRRTRPSPS